MSVFEYILFNSYNQIFANTETRSDFLGGGRSLVKFKIMRKKCEINTETKGDIKSVQGPQIKYFLSMIDKVYFIYDRDRFGQEAVKGILPQNNINNIMGCGFFFLNQILWALESLPPGDVKSFVIKPIFLREFRPGNLAIPTLKFKNIFFVCLCV